MILCNGMNESSFFWKRLTHVLLFMAVVWGLGGFVMERQHRALRASLEAEQRDLQMQRERLNTRIAHMKGKPHKDVLEIQAREVLGYVGQKDFILIQERDSPQEKVVE